MASDHINMLSPPSQHHHNRSTSSLTSEAATFHSAQVTPATEMEQSKEAAMPNKNPQADITSTVMARTDSGYEAGHERRSTSTSSSRSRRHRQSASSASGRPSTKRSARSTTSSSHRTITRPPFNARYTTSRIHDLPNDPQSHYQFFQFPSLAPSTTTDSSSTPFESQSLNAPQTDSHPHPPPPPATVHYFLLPETRRLEYAAIDAASRGVRGFITKLLPDCILPAEYRRTKFHNDGDDADSDAGSVRRYRIHFPEAEEKSVLAPSPLSTNMNSRRGNERTNEGSSTRRPGLWRRLTSLGRA